MKSLASEEELQLDIGLTTLKSLIPPWVTEACDSLLDTPLCGERAGVPLLFKMHAVRVEICQGQLFCGYPVP